MRMDYISTGMVNMSLPQVNFGVQRTTHIICVKNTIGSKLDSKAFSISAEGYTSVQIYEMLIEFKEKFFHKIFTQSVMFTDDLQTKRTHEVVIVPKSKSDHAKSFSVKLPSFSSQEISAALKQYLYGDYVHVEESIVEETV